MNDPEKLLRELPPEAPPPEVVLAAMRVFRYRAIVALSLSCALVLSAVIVTSKLDRDSRLLERIGAIRYTTGGVISVAEMRELDGLEVMLWEVVVDESPTSFVHVLAWDQQGRDFRLSVSDVRIDGRPTSLGSVESVGGGREPTHADLWQEIRLPEPPAELDSLTFTVDIAGEEVSGSIPFQVAL